MKTLCKLKKDERTDDLEKIILITLTPKYICKRCVRVAKAKGYLCHPMKMSSR